MHGSPQTATGRILLIEDSSSQASELVGALERLGYLVRWARTGVEGLVLAQTEAPDLILLDVVLSDMDGFSVCRWLKMRPDTRDVPVLMLSVQGATEHRVQGLHVGANDYILKPCADAELEARIFAALRVRAAQSELKQRNTELEAMLHQVEALAITDPLTGLFNRRRFADVLKSQFAVTKRYKNPLSCLMVDVDHFKSINDRFGHDAGDRVLQGVAQKIGENLREVDVAARYGGEEFAVLLPHTDKASATVVAERILGVIRSFHVPCGGAPVGVTVSLGIASSSDLEAESSPDDLVRAADAALYKAKEKGRDRAELYEPGEK